MNSFERVAFFTMIENIENQVRSLKTLLAASASQGAGEAKHRVTATLDHESHELSEEDEAKLEKELEIARTGEVDRMRKSAEAHFQDEWDKQAKAMASLDG